MSGEPGRAPGRGVLAALAGLVFAARLNTATPKAGLGFELDNQPLRSLAQATEKYSGHLLRYQR